MKKKIKTIAVLTVLSFMAVGCQKESLNEGRMSPDSSRCR